MAWPQWRWRVHSAFTQLVSLNKGRKLKVHVNFETFTSGQLSDLGSMVDE